MINVQEVGLKTIIQPSLINNGTTTSSTFDILQFSGVAAKLRIVLAIGATDVAFTTLKLQGSNDDSSYEDIDGSVYGTDIDINGDVSTLPGAGDDNKQYGWTVNSNSGAFRYYQIVATVANATGAYVHGFVEYGQRGNNALSQDVTTGFTELLCVPPVIPAQH
jgi:hypothetical protein